MTPEILLPDDNPREAGLALPAFRGRGCGDATRRLCDYRLGLNELPQKS